MSREKSEEARSTVRKDEIKLKASPPQTAFGAATTCRSVEINNDSHFLRQRKLMLASP